MVPPSKGEGGLFVCLCVCVGGVYDKRASCYLCPLAGGKGAICLPSGGRGAPRGQEPRHTSSTSLRTAAGKRPRLAAWLSKTAGMPGARMRGGCATLTVRVQSYAYANARSASSRRQRCDQGEAQLPEHGGKNQLAARGKSQQRPAEPRRVKLRKMLSAQGWLLKMPVDAARTLDIFGTWRG